MNDNIVREWVKEPPDEIRRWQRRQAFWGTAELTLGDISIWLGCFLASVSLFRLVAELSGLSVLSPMAELSALFARVFHPPIQQVAIFFELRLTVWQKDALVLYLLMAGGIWRAQRAMAFLKHDLDRWAVVDEWDDWDIEEERHYAPARSVRLNWLPLLPFTLERFVSQRIKPQALGSVVSSILSYIAIVVLSAPMLAWHFVYPKEHFVDRTSQRMIKIGEKQRVTYTTAVAVTFLRVLMYQTILVVTLTAIMFALGWVLANYTISIAPRTA